MHMRAYAGQVGAAKVQSHAPHPVFQGNINENLRYLAESGEFWEKLCEYWKILREFCAKLTEFFPKLMEFFA